MKTVSNVIGVRQYGIGSCLPFLHCTRIRLLRMLLLVYRGAGMVGMVLGSLCRLYFSSREDTVLFSLKVVIFLA